MQKHWLNSEQKKEKSWDGRGENWGNKFTNKVSVQAQKGIVLSRACFMLILKF